MNKYLEKIASFEKSALTRLIKEMIKRRGAGLPVSEAGFHELARRGASRSIFQYGRGIAKRDNKFMKQLGVKSTVSRMPMVNDTYEAIESFPTLKNKISESVPMIKAHEHRALTHYDPITKEISAPKVAPKGLLRSHELHEATEAKKTGVQDLVDKVYTNKVRAGMAANPNNNRIGERAEARIERLNSNSKYPTLVPHKHVNYAVIGRESNDMRTNPFAMTLSSGVPRMRTTPVGEASVLHNHIGKQYGVDKVTNKDMEKLRRIK